jgi:hypothetical protein
MHFSLCISIAKKEAKNEKNKRIDNGSGFSTIGEVQFLHQP